MIVYSNLNYLRAGRWMSLDYDLSMKVKVWKRIATTSICINFYEYKVKKISIVAYYVEKHVRNTKYINELKLD